MHWGRRIQETRIFFELMGQAGFSSELMETSGIYSFSRRESDAGAAPKVYSFDTRPPSDNSGGTSSTITTGSSIAEINTSNSKR